MVGIDTQVLGFRSGVDIGSEENEVPALGFFIGNHFLNRRLGYSVLAFSCPSVMMTKMTL